MHFFDSSRPFKNVCGPNTSTYNWKSKYRGAWIFIYL